MMRFKDFKEFKEATCSDDDEIGILACTMLDKNMTIGKLYDLGKKHGCHVECIDVCINELKSCHMVQENANGKLVNNVYLDSLIDIFDYPFVKHLFGVYWMKYISYEEWEQRREKLLNEQKEPTWCFDGCTFLKEFKCREKTKTEQFVDGLKKLIKEYEEDE